MSYERVRCAGIATEWDSDYDYDSDEDVSGLHGVVLTFAAKFKHYKPQLNHSSFAVRLGMYMTKFLIEQGSFDLNCLINIDSNIAETEFYKVPKNVIIFAKKPEILLIKE